MKYDKLLFQVLNTYEEVNGMEDTICFLYNGCGFKPTTIGELMNLTDYEVKSILVKEGYDLLEQENIYYK